MIGRGVNLRGQRYAETHNATLGFKTTNFCNRGLVGRCENGGQELARDMHLGVSSFAKEKAPQIESGSWKVRSLNSGSDSVLLRVILHAHKKREHDLFAQSPHN
jgi:hypothetical protein